MPPSKKEPDKEPDKAPWEPQGPKKSGDKEGESTQFGGGEPEIPNFDWAPGSQGPYTYDPAPWKSIHPPQAPQMEHLDLTLSVDYDDYNDHYRDNTGSSASDNLETYKATDQYGREWTWSQRKYMDPEDWESWEISYVDKAGLWHDYYEKDGNFYDTWTDEYGRQWRSTEDAQGKTSLGYTDEDGMWHDTFELDGAWQDTWTDKNGIWHHATYEDDGTWHDTALHPAYQDKGQPYHIDGAIPADDPSSPYVEDYGKKDYGKPELDEEAAPAPPAPGLTFLTGEIQEHLEFAPGLFDPEAPGPTLDPSLFDPEAPGPTLDPALFDPEAPGPKVDPALLDANAEGPTIDPNTLDPAAEGPTVDPALLTPSLAEPSAIPQDPTLADPSLAEPAAPAGQQDSDDPLG
jgi:hypothetical protein